MEKSQTLVRPHVPTFRSNPDRTIEWLGGVSYLKLGEILNQIKLFLGISSNEEIHLMVNSYGGATGIAMSFYDAVRWLRVKLVTIGSGDVDSSGIIVLLAGEKRFITKNTTLLFHLAGRTLECDKRMTVTDLEAMIKEDNLKDFQYASVVSEATNGHLSANQVLEMMRKNTILTAEEAVQLGLAHRVL